ncbi:MAG: hypothetical protein AAF610_15310 [Pseudomonadota bacterium]
MIKDFRAVMVTAAFALSPTALAGKPAVLSVPSAAASHVVLTSARGALSTAELQRIKNEIRMDLHSSLREQLARGAKSALPRQTHSAD